MPSASRAVDIISETLLCRPEMSEAEREDLAHKIVSALDTEAERLTALRAAEPQEAADAVR